jgi:competence protein ComFB
MAIKNLMEDIIKNVLMEMLKNDHSAELSQNNIEDITAYVLNRISPRYITTERGIIHEKLESKFKFQDKPDILFLIHEAILIIKNRRPSAPRKKIEKPVATTDEAFPHLIGEVLEKTTMSIIPEVKVTLLYQGSPAQMIDEGWSNPCHTNASTRGYYHFIPEFFPEIMSGKNEIYFKITFTHPKFIDKEIDLPIKPVKTVNLDESLIIPLVFLQIKDGVDISFLYE